MFKNSQEMKAFVREVLERKNIQKLPRTLASRMDDYSSAEFFGLAEKQVKYGEAIVKFCEALQAREFNSLPETVKSELLPDETLKARALVHARKVRELSELRQRIAEKQAETEVQKAESELKLREMKVQADIAIENQRKVLLEQKTANEKP